MRREEDNLVGPYANSIPYELVRNGLTETEFFDYHIYVALLLETMDIYHVSYNCQKKKKNPLDLLGQ
jgi:hypothetical protein